MKETRQQNGIHTQTNIRTTPSRQTHPYSYLNRIIKKKTFLDVYCFIHSST